MLRSATSKSVPWLRHEHDHRARHYPQSEGDADPRVGASNASPGLLASPRLSIQVQPSSGAEQRRFSRVIRRQGGGRESGKKRAVNPGDGAMEQSPDAELRGMGFG
jgi:hypothetical protein